MKQPQVLCLGEVLWDYLADQPERSPEQVESWTGYAGGAPANVACALGKLGTKAGFIGAVGEDAAGQELVHLLETLGVDITAVQPIATAPTRQVQVLRLPGGDRQFAGFVLPPGSSPQSTQFADTQLQADRLPDGLFEGAEYLVLGTVGLAAPATHQAVERSLELAEHSFLKILVDVNWRPVFWSNPDQAKPLIRQLLQGIDFLKLSDEEADWLFGTPDASLIAQQLDHLEGVLVTAGSRGCTYCLNGHTGAVSAFPVVAVDTTGAGDSFVAGFLHYLCQGGIQVLADPDLARQAVAYGSAVAALTTQKPGAIAAAPTAAEVEAFLSRLAD